MPRVGRLAGKGQDERDIAEAFRSLKDNMDQDADGYVTLYEWTTFHDRYVYGLWVSTVEDRFTTS